MKTYQSGVYEVRVRGRGLCLARLTKTQAKALFEIMEGGQLEFELINFKHN
jgi:hypothetical protein